ncbi:hypothetical protein LWC34_13075 [Kibdelosporangium philippinense]|uniref:Uncharacterized protein n=1 Tax=Kibdelosporangium philippinense TaxID=211113 RepID=A0ABS8Z8A9_9PSEU|nr:hypothetical protein [Kibdelosporangium philippinense]MCE7003752.1 hypothetical protein [Kibdelosporangium philippinense]
MADETVSSASGTFRIVNRSDEIHEMAVRKAIHGTTDADVQRFFDSGGTSPFAEPSLRGLGAVSPGRIAYLRIDRLPAASYVLLCFVPDDQSGIPHALDGMHKVVTAR